MMEPSKKRQRVAQPDTEPSLSDVWTPEVRHANDFELITADLEQHGVCVVGNILSEADRNLFENLFWDAMKKRKPKLIQHDPSTWTPDNCSWRGNYGAGQYKHYGMAQEEHCWMLRQNRVIRDIFENAMFKEECCVSLDGVAALFEPTISTLQLHVDLVPNLEGFDYGSVQGAYNLYEVATDGSKCGACFVCVPGSHHQYSQLWAEAQSKPGFKHPKKHRLLLDPESPLQKKAVKVISPANSLVLWKSEIQHKNYGGDFSVSELGGRLCRLSMFICWQPKRHRSEKDREKKISMVKDGVSGNHWAALSFREPIRPFPPWGKHTIPSITPFKKTESLPPAIEELL